jgi:hypothetical protein
MGMPLVLQVADDLADNRLGPAQVRGRLADRQRPGHGQVLKHGPGRALELAAGPVAPVKRQVHRAEPLSELLGPLLLFAHPTRVPPAHYIVNPDRFPAPAVNHASSFLLLSTDARSAPSLGVPTGDIHR